MDLKHVEEKTEERTDLAHTLSVKRKDFGKRLCPVALAMLLSLATLAVMLMPLLSQVNRY